jgi:DNA-binding transcriptional ArsR family regulator
MTATMATPEVAELDWRAIAAAGMHKISLDILELLALAAGDEDPARSPKDFADTLGVPLGVASYHVRMLPDRGLIYEARTEPRRGALQHWYRLTTTAVRDAA